MYVSTGIETKKEKISKMWSLLWGGGRSWTDSKEILLQQKEINAMVNMNKVYGSTVDSDLSFGDWNRIEGHLK